MRKMTAMALVATMIVTSLTVMPTSKVSAFERPETDTLFDGGWYGYVNEDGISATLTGVDDENVIDNEIILPSSVEQGSETYIVTATDQYKTTNGEEYYSFAYITSDDGSTSWSEGDITSVTFPDTVTEIKPYSLGNFWALTKLVLPNNDDLVIGDGENAVTIYNSMSQAAVQELSGTPAAVKFYMNSYIHIEDDFEWPPVEYDNYMTAATSKITMYDFSATAVDKSIDWVFSVPEPTSSLIEVTFPSNMESLVIKADGEFTIPIEVMHFGGDWSLLSKIEISGVPMSDDGAIQDESRSVLITRESANQLSAKVVSPFVGYTPENQIIIWSSSNPEVATISNGTITSVSVGTTIFTARNDFYGLESTFTYEVTEAEVPTTQAPTTQKPTTQKPTTQKPTTQKPTTKPAPKAQKITAKVSSKTIKYKTAKKKITRFSIGAKAKTKLTYKVYSYPRKAKNNVTVSKYGKVTVKKGAKKGTYKIRITAASSSKYKKATKVITVKVK